MLRAVLVLLTALTAAPTSQEPIVDGGSTAPKWVRLGLAHYADGEYARASEFLKPVALELPHVSAAADFALADMYEHGMGVGQDLRRAYALYLHAATSTADSYELQQLARAALARVSRTLTGQEEREAVLMASHGFRDGLSPQSFPLSAGGVLYVTAEGLAINDGHEEPWGAFSMSFEGLDMRRLETGNSVRDLLDALFWRTGLDGDLPQRTLVWRVYVIERGGIRIGCELPLLTTRGLMLLAPSTASELRARARLVARANGELVCESPRREDVLGPTAGVWR